MSIESESLVHLDPLRNTARIRDGLLAPRWYPPLKRAADALLSFLLLIGLAPFLLLAMVLVRLTSPGPALYSQTRVGRHGRLFTIYKLRTMVRDSERRSGPVWCRTNDPRVTTIGRFLRKTHLDELPQLWNILFGDMSLVGPRPERPEFVATLEQAIPRYSDRLLVLPGLTGLAQICLPPDSDLAGVRRKLIFDVHYINQLDFALDCRILLCTGLFLLGIPFRVSRGWLRVPGCELDPYARGEIVPGDEVGSDVPAS